MNANDFCYWLHGLFELTETNSLSKTQTQIIKDHLALVFNKVTPDRTEVSIPEDRIYELEAGESLPQILKDKGESLDDIITRLEKEKGKPLADIVKDMTVDFTPIEKPVVTEDWYTRTRPNDSYC